MTSAYDDIIHLPHHQSLRRKRMPQSARAAQFAPFAALTGYHEAIEEASEKEQYATGIPAKQEPSAEWVPME